MRKAPTLGATIKRKVARPDGKYHADVFTVIGLAYSVTTMYTPTTIAKRP
jgi:hypothetical protein